MYLNRFYLLAGDFIAFLCAYALGGLVFWQIRQSENLFIYFWQWALIFWVIVPIGIAWFYLKGHYTRRWPFWDEMRGIVQVLTILTILDGASIFLIKSTFSRIWFATAFSSLLILLPLCRTLVKVILFRVGKWQLATAILGNGNNARDVSLALCSERLMGFDIRFFLSDQQSQLPAVQDIPVFETPEDLEGYLSEHNIQCVIIAPDNGDSYHNQEMIERLHRFTQHLYLVPPLRGVPLYGLEIHFFFRHEVIMMRVRNNLFRPVVRYFKRIIDILGSFVLLCLLSPLLAIIGILVKRDGGRVLFGHERVGLHGRPFNCLKYRSMVPDAEAVLQKLLSSDPQAKEEWDRDYKLKSDPRVTRIGKFLRSTSLDELPQLWNVLKGEMSLVGPRPLVRDELERYGDQVQYYLEVRPGMTGLWQVSGRNDVDYSHRVYLDVWYVKNWSLWYDIVILFKTFKVVLSRKGVY